MAVAVGLAAWQTNVVLLVTSIISLATFRFVITRALLVARVRWLVAEAVLSLTFSILGTSRFGGLAMACVGATPFSLPTLLI